MNSSVPLFEKRIPHLSIPDWCSNISRIQNTSRAQRFDGFVGRQFGNQLRNECDVTTQWDTYINNERLRDRIFEVETWREAQRRCRERVRDEMRRLELEKQNTELRLEALSIPLAVSSQCLTNRDTRLRTELTHDNLDVHLKRELSVIEHHRKLLTDACHAGLDKLHELKGIFARLSVELDCKDETLALERHVRALNQDCADISHKPDPMRTPPKIITEEGWLDCTKNTIDIAETLMRDSKQIRENMFRLRETATNQLYIESEALEHIMRRRIYDIQRARNEMEWQKSKMEDHMRMLEREIEQLERSLAGKERPCQLTESRLETRARRPALELVRDRPHLGLCEELSHLNLSQTQLLNRINTARTTYHAMTKQLGAINRDLTCKNHALETDRRLIEIRKPIHKPDEGQFERNVGYVHMNRELVPP